MGTPPSLYTVWAREIRAEDTMAGPMRGQAGALLMVLIILVVTMASFIITDWIPARAAPSDPWLEPTGVAELGLWVGPVLGWATTYGASYQGRRMWCIEDDVYDDDDPTIAAVGPARYAEWPCGTELRITGPAGRAIVTRRDACPGCTAYVVDLSKAAQMAVCGPGTCAVTIERWEGL